MKNKIKEDTQDYTKEALKAIGEKTWANIKDIRHMFSLKKPYIKNKEGYVFLGTGIYTVGWLLAHNAPKPFYILGLQYCMWKALYQYLRENAISFKHRHVSQLLNGKAKIVATKDNEYILNSFIPLSVIEGKRDYLEHYFNKKIVSIDQNKKNYRHITIKTEDFKAGSKGKVKLKKIYKMSDYIKTLDTTGYKIPFVLGVDKEGNFVLGDLDKLKNISLSGIPGSGKSNLLNSIIQSLMVLNNDIAYFLVDFKMCEMSNYEDFNNVCYVEDATTLLEKLEALHDEMMSRYRRMKKKATNADKWNRKFPNEKMARICLIFDEMSELKLNCPDEETYKRIEQLITLILNKGRAANIYTIVATQRFSHVQVSTEMRANLFSKISLRIVDPKTQAMAGVMGTERLKNGEFKMITEEDSSGKTYKSFFVDFEEAPEVFLDLMAVHVHPIVYEELIKNYVKKVRKESVNLSKNS